MNKNAWVALALSAMWPWALRADTVPAIKKEIRWSLFGQDLQGKNGNGFWQTCKQAGVKTLSFTAVNEKTGKKKVTTGIPCPPDSNQGSAPIDVPDAGGPFMISAKAEGKKSSASTYVCHVTPQTEINVWIFSEGCDNPKCTDACKGR